MEGYAANGLKHSLRPVDVPRSLGQIKMASLILRKVNPKAVVIQQQKEEEKEQVSEIGGGGGTQEQIFNATREEEEERNVGGGVSVVCKFTV